MDKSFGPSKKFKIWFLSLTFKNTQTLSPKVHTFFSYTRTKVLVFQKIFGTKTNVLKFGD